MTSKRSSTTGSPLLFLLVTGGSFLLGWLMSGSALVGIGASILGITILGLAQLQYETFRLRRKAKELRRELEAQTERLRREIGGEE